MDNDVLEAVRFEFKGSNLPDLEASVDATRMILLGQHETPLPELGSSRQTSKLCIPINQSLDSDSTVLVSSTILWELHHAKKEATRSKVGRIFQENLADSHSSWCR